MIEAYPGATFEAVVEGFPTGLTGTVGVQILDNTGGVTVARTTTGIAEQPAGSGVYAKSFVAPLTVGQYTLVWDEGTISPGTVATEDLTVLAAVVSPSRSVNVSASTDFPSESGEQFTLSGQITKPANPNDAPPWPAYPPGSVAGYSCVFTAKRRKSDAAPVVQRACTLLPGGTWSVVIQSTDTSGFTKTEELAYDVTLTEPDGTRTVVCKGTWSVGKSVGL